MHSGVVLARFCLCPESCFLIYQYLTPLQLCIFSQRMTKEESMRPFMQMAHWLVEVMEHRQAPCQWPPRVMP